MIQNTLALRKANGQQRIGTHAQKGMRRPTAGLGNATTHGAEQAAAGVTYRLAVRSQGKFRPDWRWQAKQESRRRGRRKRTSGGRRTRDKVFRNSVRPRRADVFEVSDVREWRRLRHADFCRTIRPALPDGPQINGAWRLGGDFSGRRNSDAMRRAECTKGKQRGKTAKAREKDWKVGRGIRMIVEDEAEKNGRLCRRGAGQVPHPYTR